MKPKPCPEKSSLSKRPRITYEEAGEVEALFEVLANDTRVRLLQEIASRNAVCTTDLALALEMKPAAISNQLQRLQDKGILASQREGNNVYYRIVDNCVVVLLERALCLIEETKRRCK
jgi:DNA-binding transcriptional ArsR family regulator